MWENERECTRDSIGVSICTNVCVCVCIRVDECMYGACEIDKQTQRGRLRELTNTHYVKTTHLMLATTLYTLVATIRR